MLKRVSRTSLLVAKPAVINEKPAAEEQLVAIAAGEKCTMRSALNAASKLRYPLNQKTTDQYTAVIVTKPEGNPQARMPCYTPVNEIKLVKAPEFPGFFTSFLLLLFYAFHIYIYSLVSKMQFLSQTYQIIP